MRQNLQATFPAFNTLLLRVVAIDGNTMHEGFYSLFDSPGPIQFSAVDRGIKWQPAFSGHDSLREQRAFTQGYYKVEERAGV
jgi:hypothetical protein